MAATAPTALSARRLSKQVDELGALNAQISILKRKAEAIKTTLKESGFEEIYGQSYRAVISTSTKNLLDAEAVRKLLTPFQVAACTNASESTSLSLYDL